MPDDSAAGPPQSFPPCLIGWLTDASGSSVAFLVVHDAIVIRRGGKDIRLGPDERNPFRRLFMKAERHAEAWTQEVPGND